MPILDKVKEIKKLIPPVPTEVKARGFTVAASAILGLAGTGAVSSTVMYNPNFEQSFVAGVEKPLTITELEKTRKAIKGKTGKNGKVSGNSPSDDIPGSGDDDTAPADIEEALKNCSGDFSTDIKTKAHILAKVYAKIEPIHGKAAAIGIMANVTHEGSPGVVQFDKSVDNWNGDGVTVTSRSTAPVFVRNLHNVEAIEHLQDIKNPHSVGFGMIQWTWYTYLRPLGQYYRNNCTTFSDAELFNAEMEYLLKMASDAGDVLTGDYLEVTHKWLYKVENPAGKETEDPERKKTATTIYNALGGT